MNRTPGISPLALPLRPKPARRTSSFSSTKLRQPSFCENGAIRIGRAQPSHRQSPGRSRAHQAQRSTTGEDRGQRRTGTNAVTFFPFLMSWTRTHLRIAELGCLASTPTFSRTMPLACDEPPVGRSCRSCRGRASCRIYPPISTNRPNSPAKRHP